MRKNQHSRYYMDANGYMRYNDSYLDDDEYWADALELRMIDYLQKKLAVLAAKEVPYSRLSQRVLRSWIVTAMERKNWEDFPREDQQSFICMAQGIAFDMLGR